MDFYISVALIAVSALLSTVMSIPMIKILQLSGYKARGVIAWWKATNYDTLIRYIALMLFGVISIVVFIGCFSAFEYVRYCAAALYVILSAVFLFSAKKSGGFDAKFTGRVKRLIVAHAVLMLCIAAGIVWATYASVYCQALTAAFAVITPFAVIAANALMSPFERINNAKYVKRAKRKLAEKKPTVIGITGSFGKTTAKNILRAMLEKKYSVAATAGSFNTPMGICKTVNNELGDEKYFIAELGARHKGDIKELCDIVSPEYGIITAVGDMHLETFKTREAVADTKFELALALPQGGLLALNGYNADCAALGSRDTACEKVSTGDGEDVYYNSLRIDGSGTSFELVIDGVTHSVTTSLLGAHIAELVCVCAAVAKACGVSGEDIATAVREMPAVEHRLMLLPSADPAVTVIDDAYNSNPIGAKNALDVLGHFDGKKIIITPGFVELGAIEKECNVTLGRQIAEVCDYAYLIGSRAADIKKGAEEGGMSDGAVCVFASRDEAVAALKDITGNKAVLFENDLPDNIK
ncbi:MAG: UDP-N-acetylmuramoyl-tripeptide--D-alanyl-D-alanine ligase [Roseburia sp.]|nr:UDP-N-acetylmuramoyl-tripeptide--D-alanyl-D-alanine ligase [Roseburia sp.]